MTVLTTDPPYSQYTGTGERTYFEYGFEWSGQPVFVEVNGVPVTFTQQANGVVLDVPPPLDSTIVIYRKTDITQERDFVAFGPFWGQWTEDALDKLILLKQEATSYRADVNLAALHYLEYVDINNNKGASPKVYLWDDTQSGMFAGEVTEEMPLPGAFVEKPPQFVYFQYGDTPILSEELTTTLYPLENEDAIVMGMDITAFSMDTIPDEEVEFSQGFVSAFMETVLIDDGPYDEEVDFSQGLVAVEMLDILLSDGPYDDEVEFSQGLVGVEMLDKLVSAYSPEEGIEIGMDITTFDMTPV